MTKARIERTSSIEIKVKNKDFILKRQQKKAKTTKNLSFDYQQNSKMNLQSTDFPDRSSRTSTQAIKLKSLGNIRQDFWFNGRSDDK